MSSHFLKIFYALLLLLLFTSGSTLKLQNTTTEIAEIKCMEIEKVALLKFRQNIFDDSGMLSTWKDGDCCKWKGIKCSNETGHVEKLDLRGDHVQSVKGSIDLASLVVLQNLKYLDLSNNFFLGSYISQHIGSLTKLRYLDLSSSIVGGWIPCQIGNLLELEYLDLSKNWFVMNGEIPSQIGNLTRLRYLNLRDNKNIIGEIPCQLRNLSKLKYLDLEGTSLSGAIPFQVGDLPILKTLKLDVYGDLTSNNVNWLSTLSYLTNLSLTKRFLSFVSSRNFLQTISKFSLKLRELRLNGFGLIDNDVASLFHYSFNFSTSPTIIDFSNNMLTSSIFQILSNISFNLQELYLSHNNISFLPHLYSSYPSLVILDLSSNILKSSQFIDNIGFSSNLQELYLTNCSLVDQSFLVSSTSTLNSSSSLLILDISLNMLRSSEVFFWIFNFTTNLHSLNLNGNLLEGQILDGFGKVMNSLQHIDLSNNHLQGEIPSFFGNMCALKELNLSNNNLSGEVSNFIETSSWCNKHIFCGLDLSHNEITGVLPQNINILSKLTYLKLEGNSLEGEFNESHLTYFSKLRALSLSYNSLSLNFSRSWIPPFQLTYLMLASCKLGSSFPSWLQTQRHLMTLDISDTGLNDYVPEWFWNNSQYMLLMNMSHNNLIGRIPDFPFKLPQNPAVLLNSNQFEGGIPSFLLQASHLKLFENKFSHFVPLLCDEIPQTTNLATLDLSNNQIKGQLPDFWKSINTLLFLDLSNNKISGKIPRSIGTLVKLKALVLRNNSLDGELSSTLKNCANLMLLDVSENLMSGPIPTWIGENMKQLLVLSMTGNRFSGSLPTSLCYLKQIQLLNLARNSLSQGIPKCLRNFTALAEKNINMRETESRVYWYNPVFFQVYGSTTFMEYVLNINLYWKGMERDFKHPEMILKSIDLSSNNLTGRIPKEIGYLIGLVSLNLSRNNLNGEIPSEIGKLVSLDFLDLSKNYLSGKIPPTLSQIDRLEILDLSNNSLYGRIPFGRQLQTLDPSGFEGNLDLCGKPLAKVCPEDVNLVNPQVSKTYIEDENHVFHEGLYMSLGLGYFTGFWGLMGSLLLFLPWRIVYLRFLNKLTVYIHVWVVVNVTKFQIWIKD